MEQQGNPVSLLDLATSHVTQHTKGHIKSDWSIQLNSSNTEVCTLPKCLGEQDVFRIMDFIKEYELKAFNTGIKFQKNEQNLVLKDVIQKQKHQIELLAEENIRLANAIEQITSNL
jgi:hypothetical protein